MHDLASGRDELLDELMDESGDFENFEAEDAVLGETEEELAAQLLEAHSDQELDYFFGKVLKGAKGFLKSPAGKALTGALRGVAKKALPMAGKALGNMVVPGLGGVIGGGAGNLLGSLLEMETLADEDVQLEVAKRVVRTARQAGGQVARDVRAGADPRTAVQTGLITALKRNLPGLVGGLAVPAERGFGRNAGRWYRRGNRIILVGA